MLLRLVLVFVCFALFSAQSIRPKLDSRIVGGEDAPIADFYYQVSVQLRGQHICGGTLVGLKSYVITSAQCTDGLSANELSVRAGTDLLNSGGEVKSVQTVHQHPKYDQWTYDYDIAILKLISAFDSSNNNIKDAGLPTVLSNPIMKPDYEMLVTGWGATEEGGSPANSLQVISLLEVIRANCEAAFGRGFITERMRCATADGKDACLGDTGGPLVVNETVLVGITSWGFGCARPGYPGVYTDIINEDIRKYVLEIVGF